MSVRMRVENFAWIWFDRGMKMRVENEAEMVAFGEKVAGMLGVGAQIELVGDVGAGKTTFVKGLARGLGVEEVVSSPSFVINKKYVTRTNGMLSHYDFYRLEDPGVMAMELSEAMNEGAIVVVEWGESVSGVMSDDRVRVGIGFREDGGRDVEVSGLSGEERA